MRTLAFIAFTYATFMIGVAKGQSPIDLDAEAAKTNLNELPYDVSLINVRGFDGDNPPPRLVEPERPLFYGYGLTAYYQTKDSLLFFRIEKLDIIHHDNQGNEIQSFPQKGSRYSETFKKYFLSEIPPSEKKNILLQNIYLKDKKGNYLKLEKDFVLCPNCQD